MLIGKLCCLPIPAWCLLNEIGANVVIYIRLMFVTNVCGDDVSQENEDESAPSAGADEGAYVAHRR